MASPKRTRQHDFFVYVDTVVFTINTDRSIDSRDRLEVLVMKRPDRPDHGKWALPGGLVDDHEPLEDTAIRKVAAETGLAIKRRDIHQVGAFGDPDRDPRWRAISVAYVALVPRPGDLLPRENSEGAAFIPYRQLTSKRMLEFDHADIVVAARDTARRMLEDTNVALSFCRSRFTISELRNVYEAFLQHEVDPANFRRKVEATDGFVVGTDEYADFGSAPGRPAQMYRAGSRQLLSSPIRFRKPEQPARKR